MRITLCGSTRFKEEFEKWNKKLGLSGHSVYSLSFFARQEADAGKEGAPTVTDQQKITLDLVHLDKILNSDAVVVIDVDGYIGFSTKREIEWARMQGKKVYWITPDLSRTNPNWYRYLDNPDTWAGCLLRNGE